MLKHLAWPAWLLFLALFALAILVAPSTVAFAGFRLDALFWLLAPFVAFVGANVAHFATRYMDGEPEPHRFWWRLTGLLLAALLLLASDHIGWFIAAWGLMAWWLADLIGYRRDTATARAAGRVARTWLMAGTAALAVGLIWLALAAGTSIAGIAAEANAQQPPLLPLAFIFAAAIIQCALPPASRWLMSSMTAPTPVSALMHAGMVNAGGIVVVRLALVAAAHPASLHALFLIGGLAALLGSLFALVQSDIKRHLAASTVAQMGFMIAQCGLGLFGAAIAHLMLHGLYKARLFLGAGSAVRAHGPTDPQPVERWMWLVAVPSAVLAALLFASVSGKQFNDAGAVLVLFAGACALRVAYGIAASAQLPGGSRALVIPLILLPGAALYGWIVAFTNSALAPLGLNGLEQPLHWVHLLVVAGFGAVAVWDASGAMRRSPRLYAWVSSASRPAPATVAPHRSLHHA